MSEPGRFSLERLVSDLPARKATLLAALLAIVAAVFFGRSGLAKIPEFVETGYGYDAQLRATVGNRSLATKGLPVTFIDIDDDAVKAWGDATRTMPRKKLAEILAFVEKKQPKMVFLDFDLSRKASNGGDGELEKYLKEYAASSPPLLLTSELEPKACSGEACKSDPCTTTSHEPVLEVGASPFDSLVAEKPNVFWVSSVFVPEDDGVVRSWRLWNLACKQDQVTPVPSAQLVTAALASSDSMDDGKKRLGDYLAYVEHHPQPTTTPAWPRNLTAHEALIPFLIGGSAKAVISDLSEPEFRYHRVRAESVLADQVADTAYKDRVLVIGASYGPDKFGTPFGVMPGAALMANAIAVAPAVLANPSHPYAVIVLTAILALFYGAVAKIFRAIPAAVIILAVSYAWLSLSTYSLNPVDAVTIVSTALVLLGAFLALESVIEIIFDLAEGKRFSALLRQGHSPEVYHRGGEG